MRDRDAESAAVRPESTARAVLLGTVVVPLSALLAGPVSGGIGQAAATVGYVLAEALVLYVGYGALARVVNPAVRERLEHT